MAKIPGRTPGRRENQRKRAARRQSGRKAITIEQMIEKLEVAAENMKAAPGTVHARQGMTIEMHGVIVDSLNLSAHIKKRVGALLAKRIRILQTLADLESSRLMGVDAALAILRDVKTQIRYHRKFLLGNTPPKRVRSIRARLDVQIAKLEAMKQAGAKKTRLMDRETQRELLGAANMHNILLRNHFLGPELDRFNELEHEIMERYLNVDFPILQIRGR